MKRLLLLVALLLPTWTAPHTASARDAEVERQVEILERFAKEPFEQKEREEAIRALGRIGGAEAAAALLPLFDDPFVHLRDHAVSAWIAMMKGARAAETVAWFAKKGVRQRNPEVRAGIATALGFGTDRVSADLLAERLQKEKDPTVLVALLRTVGRRGLPEGDWDPEMLLTKRGGEVALAAADALARHQAFDRIPEATRNACVASRDPLVQAAGVLAGKGVGRWEFLRTGRLRPDDPVEPWIALAELLARTPPPQPWTHAEPLVRGLLGGDAWRVRAAAIDLAVGFRQREVVPLLIERLAVERGRLRLDLADALADLTGTDLGPDPELWSAWWAAKEGTWKVPPPGRAGTPPPPPPEGGTKAASFFRLPVYGTRIAFLLDCSGSMRDPFDPEEAGGPSKLDLARRELEETLAGLGEDVSFDVFLYRYPSEYPPRPAMARALGGLKPGSEANARKATAWLGRQEAKGWGAFSDALTLLLAEDVDTIYFLSDGRPSRGRFDRGFRLIDELKRANRFRRVVIHTVLTGRQRADREFLEDLARATGGRFSDAGRGSGR